MPNKGPHDMANHPNRSKRGRPQATEDTRYQRLNVTLPPEIAAKLRAQPDGVSATIARLVRDFL